METKHRWGQGPRWGLRPKPVKTMSLPQGWPGTKALTGTEPQRRSLGALGHKTRAGRDPAGEAETKTEIQTERRT